MSKNNIQIVYQHALRNGQIYQLGIDSSDNFYWNNKPLKQNKPWWLVLPVIAFTVSALVIAYVSASEYAINKKMIEEKINSFERYNEQATKYETVLKEYEQRAKEYDERLKKNHSFEELLNKAKAHNKEVKRDK